MTTTTCDLTAAVELARLAPSVHNTQPWRFQIEDSTLTLSRDPGRRLETLDPTGRQQVVSCGAALHLARLALRLQGYDCDVVTFPALADRDVLARIVPVPGHPATSEDVVLAEVARSRHTQRGPFDPRPLPPDVVVELRAAAQERGVWARAVDDPADLVALAVLLTRAEDLERDDPAYREELGRWTGRPDHARDGLPATAVPDVHGRASTLRPRDFGASDPEAATTAVEPPTAEHPLAVVLGTELDGPADWLRAGEALMALLLRAAVEGIQAQPLGQVVDRDWSRARLGAELGVVGHPQMVLRLGYGRPGPDTPRRRTADILD
jgi:nitroreductase